MLFFIPLIMNKKRCRWCEGDTLYEDYHDKEWGVTLFDDRLLFEFLTIETFQAGLSWITVLRKREHFRKAFDSFNYQKIATYDAEKVATLLLNRGIIRNRLKIEATIKNAEAFMLVQKKYSSFSSYIWDFVSGKPIINQYKTLKQIPAHTPLAEKISKDLKQKGFKFVGPTVVYAHMQATGMVNDHLIDCYRHSEITLEG